jgi:DNA-directed RNA polymerase subunit RPC12/RpoP
MAFTIQQACPQCGAPSELQETDRLLRCPYCRVKSFLFARDYFRFILPNKAPDKEIVYAPYLRFKGAVYSCHGQGVTNRVLDITKVGIPIKGLPISLGVRSQVLKLSFLTPDTRGSFLPLFLTREDVLKSVAKQASRSGTLKLFHQACIGDVINLIYLPLYMENGRAFDGITRKPLMASVGEADVFSSAVEYQPGWRLFFMGTLCPRCGWNLDGERDSAVLTCRHCSSAWEALEGKFSEIRTETVSGEDRKTVYLPFWKVAVKISGIPINSYADFLRVTNQPRVIQKDWETSDMSFWSPAFKIWPQVFLRAATQLTVAQKDFSAKEGLPDQNLYPVTMPYSEAIQSLKLILANATYTKKRTFPLLPGVDFTVKDSSLLCLPFTDKGLDLVQQQLRFSINKNALEFGHSL